MALTAASTLFGNIVKWGAPSQECVAYFKIYRRADNLTAEVTDKIAEVAWSKNPHFVDLFSNLNNNTAYRYYVRAISYGDKSSALSAKISATVTTTINIGSTGTISTNILGQTISLGGATSVVSMGAKSIKVGTACSTMTFEGKQIIFRGVTIYIGTTLNADSVTMGLHTTDVTIRGINTKIGTAAQTIQIGGATSAITFPANVGGWISCPITAGGTSICTYIASGDTTILNIALQITAEASADVCTVSISGGGTDFLIGAKATAPITHQCSGICTLSSGNTIAAVMTATVSDEIAGKLQINRIVFI